MKTLGQMLFENSTGLNFRLNNRNYFQVIYVYRLLKKNEDFFKEENKRFI